MYITSFAICEKADITPSANSNEDVTTIIQPYGNIVLPFFPTLYSFAMSIGIGDVEENKEIVIQFKSPADIALFEIKVPMPKLCGQYPASILNLHLNNIKIAEEGIYKTEISCENATLGMFPIRIFKQKWGINMTIMKTYSGWSKSSTYSSAKSYNMDQTEKKIGLPKSFFKKDRALAKPAQRVSTFELDEAVISGKKELLLGTKDEFR